MQKSLPGSAATSLKVALRNCGVSRGRWRRGRVAWEDRLKRRNCFLRGSKQASSVAESTARPCIESKKSTAPSLETHLGQRRRGKPASEPLLSDTEVHSNHRGRRAAAKSLVHLSRPSGGKVEFDDQTRSKLQSALSRLKPAPSPQNVTRMIGVAKLVVSNLNAARAKVEKKAETASEERGAPRFA